MGGLLDFCKKVRTCNESEFNTKELLKFKAYVKMVLKMGEITIKARIPKELEGSEKEIEKILKKRVEG